MNNKITNIARKLIYAGVALVLTLCVATTAANAEPGDLPLAQAPLFTGSNVEPNVLVAMDNSRTMDFETLMPTRNGALYWKVDDVPGLLTALGNVVGNLTSALGLTAKEQKGSFWNDQTNQFVQASSEPYVSLFPNGYNNSQDKFRRVNNVDNADSNSLLGFLNGALLVPLTSVLGLPSVGDITRLLDSDAPLELDNVLNGLGLSLVNSIVEGTDLTDWYSRYVDYYAVPPLPSLAFARSPDFNRAYFNPAFTYKPWPGYPDADPTAAPFDPAELGSDARTKAKLSGSGDNQLNLTQVFRSRNDGYRFDLRGGMNPENSEYEFYGNYACGLLYLFDCRGWVKKNTYSLLGGLLGFLTDIIFGDQGGTLGMEYYPATFYLKLPGNNPTWSPDACNALLPAGYPIRTGPLKGDDPQGRAVLCGFEVQLQSGTNAMQNFANWFTYYRKPHLATRGGLTSALDQVSGLRVGVTATNDTAEPTPDDLDMISLDDAENRSSVYNQIFNLDFSKPLGAPNRQALNFLGQQLENNDTIIKGDSGTGGSCRRNATILVTNGYNTGQVTTIGDLDHDSHANTIADIAYRYYNNLEIPSGIQRGQVPVAQGCDAAKPDPWLDCKTDPHMTTFGITLGQRGIHFDPTAYSAHQQYPFPKGAAVPPWSTYQANNIGKAQIDDLWHATVNGHGRMFYANTPADMAAELKNAFGDILTTGGSGSSVAVKSGNLDAASKAYTASFISGEWSGELSASSLGVNDGVLSPTPDWTAAKQLSEKGANKRIILTTAGQTAKAFRWDNLSGTPEAQDNELNRDLVNYIRGDQSNELANGGTFRNRGSNILGDIVHSTPLYVGPPDRKRYPVKWSDLLHKSQPAPENSIESYHEFASDPDHAGQRKPMVYVGANDGMLHGFSAQTGDEKLAYVPNAILDNLGQLSDPNYTHHYYVDGSPVSGDVVFGGSWHTVLVGGLQAGGRSVYALDVTAPSGFSETTPGKSVLWEYQNDDLGYVYGKPSIVRLHDDRWAALFGNGYNSENRTTALFVIDIGTGACIAKLSAYGGSTSCDSQAGNAPYGKPHGLSEPFPVDLDGDFITDYAYAGDLQGNVWRFDLTNAAPSQWSATKVFTATDSSGNPEPITSQPQIGAHPYGLNYGVMVYFGTGQYLEDSDRTSLSNNTFYGIWDPGVFTASSVTISEPASRGDLVAQTIIKKTKVNGNTYRAVSDNTVDYQPDDAASADSYDRGWLLDLPGSGERVVTNAQLQEGSRGVDDTVAFSTLIPGSATACGASGGGFFMVLNQLNGGRTYTPVFDLNGDLSFNSQDAITDNDGNSFGGASGREINGGIPGMATHQTNQSSGNAYYIVPTSDGKTTTIPIPLLGKDGRVSWREIRR